MRHKWDFFIAHAGGDKRIAEILYELLFNRSRVFLDSKSLILGDNWNQELPTAQKQSLITVVIISSHTENAYYEKEEIAAAIQMARNNQLQHRVIPVFILGYNEDEVPYGLVSKHSLVLNNEAEIDVAAESLLDALQKVRKKRRGRLKESKNIKTLDSLEKALQILNKTKEILNAQLIVFNHARITPRNCDECINELLEVKESSNQFLIKNDSKPVANQIIFLYKFEEDIVSLVDLVRQFRKISIQTDSEDIKQQIILGMQNLIKDVDSLVRKIKG
jgi:hypothetical protein